MYISEAVQIAIDNEEGDRSIVAKKLGVSNAMLSHYINRDNMPRLNVAGRLWGHYGLVVEPFTEVAVIREWQASKGD